MISTVTTWGRALVHFGLSGRGPRHEHYPASSRWPSRPVPGPEQMKQGWIAAKDVNAWHKEMMYFKADAQKQHVPMVPISPGGGVT